MKFLGSLALRLALVVVSGYALAQQPAAAPATPARPPQRASEGAGATIYGNTCLGCHGKVEHAPPPEMLRKLTPEKIYQVITTGSMATHVKDLTDVQKIAIAEWASGRKLGSTESGDAKTMSNVCTSHPPVRSTSTEPAWNGWSPDPLRNTRFQSAKAAGLSPAGVGRLQLKWAFGLPATSSAYGQPTIVDGRIFVGSDSGYMYSLDAKTGCVHWSFQAQSGLRSAPMLAPIRPGATQMAAFFGDIRGNVYALDASNGELLWQKPIDPHPLSRITASPKVHEGRVYITVASLEEPESASFNYPCCTFRGIVAALESGTGKQIWKTYTITETPTKRKNALGKEHFGPAGAGVWGPATLDVKRRAVYISTGNPFSAPDVGRGDAVMALDMDNGAIRWVKQAMHGDVWHTGCPQGPSPAGHPPRSAHRRPNTPVQQGRGGGRGGQQRPDHYYCPDEKENPDWDFSAGTMLVDLPNGKSLVLAGQKSGGVWAHDPDKQGELAWYSDISRGQILFGAAADGEQAYFAMRGGYGGLVAVRLSDGLERWFADIPPQPSMDTHPGISAAVSLIPGAVFTAGLDGMLRAFSTFDGKPLWQYDTTQPVKTVNGIEAAGGSIGSAGATIANGMVYVTSGYTGFQGGHPGNLLLAFGPPED
ncbi:MAG: PQQ-binding-like beta-propeller repeat protein [Candidatus Korobacteraceae bacterium]